LKKLGARLVIRTIEDIADNKIIPLPQTQLVNAGELMKPAPKIHPENCIIDWNNNAIKIHNFIRGLSPSPGARSSFKKDSTHYSFKIFESLPEISEHNFQPGKIISDGKQSLRIACKNGFINIICLQLEGKTRMNSAEFLKGFRIAEYTIPLSLQV
jgi:methionyl-tRNA formyltransferase